MSPIKLTYNGHNFYASRKVTAQKVKFSIEDIFTKCDQIRWKLWIWSHLLKKSLMESFIFFAVGDFGHLATPKSKLLRA